MLSVHKQLFQTSLLCFESCICPSSLVEQLQQVHHSQWLFCKGSLDLPQLLLKCHHLSSNHHCCIPNQFLELSPTQTWWLRYLLMCLSSCPLPTIQILQYIKLNKSTIVKLLFQVCVLARSKPSTRPGGDTKIRQITNTIKYETKNHL